MNCSEGDCNCNCSSSSPSLNDTLYRMDNLILEEDIFMKKSFCVKLFLLASVQRSGGLSTSAILDFNTERHKLFFISIYGKTFRIRVKETFVQLHSPMIHSLMTALSSAVGTIDFILIWTIKTSMTVNKSNCHHFHSAINNPLVALKGIYMNVSYRWIKYRTSSTIWVFYSLLTHSIQGRSKAGE